MQDARFNPARLGALAVVGAVVGLNATSAVLLKTIADHRSLGLALLLLGLAGVVLINLLRFWLWGMAHGRYPLSETYPLTSLFFPVMLLISWRYGEPVGARQIFGTCLITLGVVWLTLRKEASPAKPGAASG